MFCQWVLQQCGTHLNFPVFVIFTDEAQYIREGIQNFHKVRRWKSSCDSFITSPIVVLHRHLASIYGDSLFGLNIHLNRLTERNYKAFTENNMPDFLADVPLIICRELHFMRDGTPTHFSLVAHSYLNRKFPGRRIGRGGSIASPPHSPDLNPWEFYLWGQLKTFVYSSPVDDVKTLWNWFLAGFQTIRNMPGIWLHLWISMRRRA
jgi:hypothetical protein